MPDKSGMRGVISAPDRMELLVHPKDGGDGDLLVSFLPLGIRNLSKGFRLLYMPTESLQEGDISSNKQISSGKFGKSRNFWVDRLEFQPLS
jgi:hypothetical protein